MNKKMRIFKDKHFYYSVLFLIFAAVLNFISSNFIQKYFPDRAAPPDLLFKITHYVGWTQYLTDLANILSFILVIYYFIKYRYSDIYYLIITYATAYILRACLIVLTPLGGALGNDMHYGITNIQQFGAFPSGHTIMVVLASMMIDKNDSALMKYFALSSIFIEIISLILSRGHYSIDIVGAFLLCYFVFNESLKFRPRLQIPYDQIKNS